MKRIEQSVLLAGLLAMTLGACTSTGMQDTTGATAEATVSESASMQSPTSSAQTSTGTASATEGSARATGSTADMQQSTQSGAMASTPNSTVSNIEVIPRQGDASATSAGTVAGAAVGGTGATSGAMGSDRVYRITLRMDDGSVRTVTQESVPAFATGDRVRLADDAIVR